jgi:long-chain acyl-CoA synthetase
VQRPWTRFYHEQTSKDLPPLAWPHLPAFIREAVRQHRNRPAFTLYLPNGTQGTLTYGEVDRLSDDLAVYLREVAGFSAGDRIALQMPNCLAYPVAVFACLKAGLVMANTNPLYTPAEMTHQFSDSGAVGLIVIDLFAAKVAEALPKTSIRKVIVVTISDLLPTVKRLVVYAVQKYVKKMIPRAPFPHVTFARALADGRAQRGARAGPLPYEAMLTRESIAALQYTGGTTGVAKGAVLTHGNLLSNIVQGLEAWRPRIEPGKEVMLTALPLYHIFAFTANLMIFFAVGGRNILIPSPRPFITMQGPFTHEPITWFTGVNTLFVGLLNEPWFQQLKNLKLKGTVAGGMALVPAVEKQWADVTGTPMFQGYGLTESSPVVTMNPFHRPKTGSIGVPVPGTDVRLVDSDGRDVAPGEAGELLVKGPQVMQGYWQRPEETANVLRDGWLATGDIATLDEDGYVSIVDRKKDMIVVSGFKVYPSEVEAVIAEHPGVKDVAVIGVPDPLCGEAVHAYVVRRDPSITEDDIRRHCKKTLTNYKVPKAIIFREDLPKSNVGKVIRKDLRAEALQHG